MCAIIDANVGPEVFGDDRTPRGRLLYEWLTRGRTGRLVVGGKLLRELRQYGKFKVWLNEAISAGRARRIRDAVVDSETEAIRAGQSCRSNDHHILALARVSGARLLFTNDRYLEKDFKDRSLVPDPRGKIYKDATHSRLLNQHDLCPAPSPDSDERERAGAADVHSGTEFPPALTGRNRGTDGAQKLRGEVTVVARLPHTQAPACSHPQAR